MHIAHVRLPVCDHPWGRDGYPFEALGVGESFWAANPRSARQQAMAFRRKTPGWDYRSRTEEIGGVKGCRVWRTN